MKLIRNTNISTYSSIISQETEEGEISSEVQAKAAAKQVSLSTKFLMLWTMGSFTNLTLLDCNMFPPFYIRMETV